MDILKVEILVWLAIVGAAFGSFACCQAWRLHEAVEKKKMPKRSVCMNCGYQLKWFDNVPIFSWLVLGGRCRKCHKPIGTAEILTETGMAALFLLVGLKFWDLIVAAEGVAVLGVIFQAVILLALLVCFGVLAVYDAKWQELPTSLLIASNVLAVAYLLMSGLMGGWNIDWIGLIAGIGILAGVYYVLYFFSQERLVGSGDWVLCLAIAIAFADWKLAIFELFLSNFIALIVSAPAAILKKQKQVPFGPFLVVTFVIVMFIVGPQVAQYF